MFSEITSETKLLPLTVNWASDICGHNLVCGQGRCQGSEMGLLLFLVIGIILGNWGKSYTKE